MCIATLRTVTHHLARRVARSLSVFTLAIACSAPAYASDNFQFSSDGVLWYMPRENVRLSKPSENLPLETALYTVGLGTKPDAPLHFYRLPLVDLEQADEATVEEITRFIDGVSRSHRVARIELLDLITPVTLKLAAATEDTEPLEIAPGSLFFTDAHDFGRRSWDLAWKGMTEARIRNAEIDVNEIYGALVRQLVDEGVIEAPLSVADEEEQRYMLIGLNLPLRGFENALVGEAVLRETPSIVPASSFESKQVLPLNSPALTE